MILNTAQAIFLCLFPGSMVVIGALLFFRSEDK